MKLIFCELEEEKLEGEDTFLHPKTSQMSSQCKTDLVLVNESKRTASSILKFNKKNKCKYVIILAPYY